MPIVVAAVAQAALAQGPPAVPGPEAVVALYRVWNPQNPAVATDGRWDWDQGIASTDTNYYFDHDRGTTDQGNVWEYRWGDQVQIVVEASLPIFYRPGFTGQYDLIRHAVPDPDNPWVDRFPDLNPWAPPPDGVLDILPPDATITVRGNWRYKHASWTLWSPWEPCSWPDPVPPPYAADPAAWARAFTPPPLGYPPNSVKGIDWPAVTWTHWTETTGGTNFWARWDAEPGSGPFTDTYWSDPANGGPWQFEFRIEYIVNYSWNAAGDVFYPNPMSQTSQLVPFSGLGSPAKLTPAKPTPGPGECVLNQNDLVVDWIDPNDPKLNDGLSPKPVAQGGANNPLGQYINPLYWRTQPSSFNQKITSASLELVGPDLDPLTPGAQSPRWTITNGRIASSVVGTDGNILTWRDFDNTVCMRWDERTTTGSTPTPEQPPSDASWKRIVRLAFGGTGYPGSRGWGGAAPQEGRFPYFDDPDALKIGPQPGLRFFSTEAFRKAGSPGVFGLLPADRLYAPDPIGPNPASGGYQDVIAGRMDCPFTPGVWTVQNLTVTVSPDPATPDDPDSYKTIVIPVHPRAPWDVPTRNAAGTDVTLHDDPVGTQDTRKARNWFVVDNPLDTQVARADEATATVPSPANIGSGRFGTVGNPGNNQQQRQNFAGGGAQHRYYLAQGNHDFPSVFADLASTLTNAWDELYWWDPDAAGGTAYRDAGWRWVTLDWDGNATATTDPLPGWSLPILDLGAGTAGSSVGWVRSAQGRSNDGLWISNMSHIVLRRIRGKAIVYVAPNTIDGNPAYDPLRQDDGPGTVRVEAPPLRPVVTTSADYGASPVVVAYNTATSTDYLGRPLPNGAYPSISGGALTFGVNGRNLLQQGLDALNWSRAKESTDSSTAGPYSLETSWSAYDRRDATGTNHVFRGVADTESPQRVLVTIDVPKHQPAMMSPGPASDPGDWTRPSGQLEVLSGAEPPVCYYETADPDDITVPAWSGPGTDATDHQSGSATLSYDITAGRSEEEYMVKVYVDVNGNGKLDLARPDLAQVAWEGDWDGTNDAVDGPADPDYDPYWYRFLYEEPYRVITVRAKVLPDFDVAPMRKVADFGIYGHADPRSWHSLPSRDLLIESRGNLPMGVLPLSRPDGQPRIGEIGLWTWNPWRSDEAEQGVVMPVERLMPNYVYDGDPSTTGWSIEPAPTGVDAAAGDPFIDRGPRNGRSDPGERLGSRVIADALAAGTPLGTYWLSAFPYVDFPNASGAQAPGYQPGTDFASATSTLCKVTIKETPLPPINPGPSRDDGKDVDAGGDVGPDNANSTYGELGPAFLVNTWAIDGAGIPQVMNGDADGAFGDTATFFSSNRPSDEPTPIAGPAEAWNIWGQRFNMNWTGTPSGPINPTFEPTGPAYLIAGDPSGYPGVVPPEPRFTLINSYRHHAPSIVRQTFLPNPAAPPLVIMTWTLEVEWSEDPAATAPRPPQTVISYYGGGALMGSQDGFLGGTMGRPIFGPIFVTSPSGAGFGPKPVLIPRGPMPTTDYDIYVYYYTGSGTQRRLAYLLWRLAAAPGGGLTYMGTHELPVMTRHGSNGVRLDGLLYAKDPQLFADVWYEPGIGWHGGPYPTENPDIGVVFSGRSTSFGTEDIFYTRYDPGYATNPGVGNGGGLSDPANYNPTNNNTGQVAFPEQTDVPLAPLRSEALTAGSPDPGTRHHVAYASEMWVDWIHDLGDPADPGDDLSFTVNVDAGDPAAGGTAHSWNTWREDPVSGYLYAVNPGGGREVEVDPTVGLVRFVDDTIVPNQTQTVTATFIPQTMRLTRASQDSGQPVVALLPPETIDMPYAEALTGGIGNIVRTPVDLPLRMVLLYKRFDPQGRVRLMYETFSMPFCYPSEHIADPTDPAAPTTQLFWQKITNPGTSGNAYPVIDYPVNGGSEPIPFYTDRPPTHVPLDETAGELYVTAQPAQYVWYTAAGNMNLADPLVSPYIPPFEMLGGLSGGLREVVGPTVIWFMFSSTAEKLPFMAASGTPGEDWQNEMWGLYGGGDETAYGYDADWDMYFGVLSPQAIPRTTILDMSTTGSGT